MNKYSKRIILIHWLTLALLIVAWFLGDMVNDARHDGGASIGGYLAHMIAGAVVLLLTLARLVFRSKDGVPPPMGDTPADKFAKLLQYVLYAMLLLLPLSGVMQVLTSDIGAAIAAGDASLLPAKFEGVMAHGLHEVLVNVLIVLVVIHVLGALKHQFVMKDNIMDRMSLKRD